MSAVVLAVLPDGSVQGRYTEAIDLASLGQMRIQRASTIEFDNPAQIWRVFDRRGRCLFSHASREVCLRWEAKHLLPD